MKKPLLLTLEYPPQIGGVARYLEAEVKSSPIPVVVKTVDGPRWMNLIFRRRNWRGCNYLWLSHVLPIGYVALVWKWIYKTPYRVYLHGLDLVRPLRSPWKKFWVKRILAAADEIVVNSHATAELLGKYGISASRARVQYPRIEPINPSLYIKRGKELREQYKIGDKPLLLTASRLIRRKGIDLVLQVLPEIWKTIPDLVYVIVGDGEERERLFVIASEAKQSQNIIFTGSVSDEEKYGWLATCDCFILTPIDTADDFEGYGIVYKEAQMFAKPVIGSRVGGVPEAIGDNGVIIEPGNINQIIKTICHLLFP